MSEHLLAVCRSSTVGKREFKVLGEELLDVGTTDAVGLLDLDNTENLQPINLSKHNP